ncbi:MAG: hypothetical protein ABR878_04235 [Roseiarcus sp.]
MAALPFGSLGLASGNTRSRAGVPTGSSRYRQGYRDTEGKQRRRARPSTNPAPKSDRSQRPKSRSIAVDRAKQFCNFFSRFLVSTIFKFAIFPISIEQRSRNGHGRRAWALGGRGCSPKTRAASLPLGLAFADATASYFMLEIDRGAMPVVRKGTNRTSFARKLKTYYDGWKQKRHEKQLGIRQFRVLTVTTSPVRVETMVAAVRALAGGVGSNVFLFADVGNLDDGNALEFEWISGKGERVRVKARICWKLGVGMHPA